MTRPHGAPAQARPPTWLAPLMAFMGACTPGGFLFLVALLTNSKIDLDEPLWYILAAICGFTGWRLGKSVR